MGPSFLAKKWAHPKFSAHVCCGQTAGWIKIPLVTEVGLGPDHIVLDGDPAPHLKRSTAPSTPPPQKKGTAPPIVGPCRVAKRLGGSRRHLEGGRPRPRPNCARWGPSSLPKRGHSPRPILGTCLLCQKGWMDQDATRYHGGRPWPRPHCARWDPASPRKGAHPSFRPMYVVAKRLDGSRYHLMRR